MSTTSSMLLQRIGKMDPTSVEEYKKLDGYKGLEKAITMKPTDIIAEIEVAKLRGRGGAAFPAGTKWRQLYEMTTFPKYIAINADEGEPGTFKDKILLRDDPLSVIEGMTITGYVFGAAKGFIYIRGEYQNIQKKFKQALANARAANLLGDNILGVEGFNYDIEVISGAGAYVCGENSALLNSIEGKTGRPRIKPPHLAEVGLYQKPTLVNNVESITNISHILNMGGEAYFKIGTEEGGGTKLVCLSGHIKNPGIYEVALGTPLKDILYSDEYGGGSSTDKKIKFCHFGGQSGPIGYAEDLDLEYSFDGLWNNGLAIGSGAIVVMDESVSIVDYLHEVVKFFVHESCGKCTPCRLGTTRVRELLGDFLAGKAKEGDIERLDELLNQITNLSACGLGQSVAVSIRSAMKRGKQEFVTAIK